MFKNGEFIVKSMFVSTLGIVSIFWLRQYCNSLIDSIFTACIVCGVVLLLIDIIYNKSNKNERNPIINFTKKTNNNINLSKDMSVRYMIDCDIPNINLKNYIGNEEVKKDVTQVIDFLKNPSKFEKMGAEMPKGMIFYGPPGTGKTLLAKVIAGEAGVPFLSLSGSDFVEMFVGVGAKRVRELFELAKANSPCIIFIDEIDAIGKKRGGASPGNDERDNTINALLKELDGFTERSKIIVIGATNRIDLLDDALIRPGRFDKLIAIEKPQTNKERLDLIRHYSKNKPIDKEVSFESIAKQTIGFSPVDIKNLLNESSLIAISKNKKIISKEDIEKAYIQIILKGHLKENSEKEKKELELIAWHEAGHAVVGKLLGMSVPKVTIVPSTTGAGGLTLFTPKSGLLSRKDLENEVMKSYGGRIAEFLLLGNESEITTGASNDIEKASSIIKNMVTEYGMSKKFGFLNLETLNIDKKDLLQECISISKNIYNNTLKLLSENKTILQDVANLLLEKETINEYELDEILNKRKYENENEEEILNTI